jgi:hypothetical protein
MKKFFSVFLLSLIALSACEKEDYFEGAYECQNNSSNRIGAICNDCTKSMATGSGACSSHDGVRVWLCK